MVFDAVCRGFHNLHESDGHLADLFVTLLGHPEPEQRFVVLQHLGRLVGQDMHGEAVLQSNTIIYKLLSPDLVLSVPESFLLLWFQVGPLLRLSLALIAGACLYSPAEDISLILKIYGEYRDYRIVKNWSLPTNSVQSCFDMFSKKIDQEAMELEEAEMELEILQKEHAVQESSKDSKEDRNNPWITASVKEDNRLQEIKDRIRSLEKAAEAEKEIERQRLLELECAKTRELRHNLDMEKERQTQARPFPCPNSFHMWRFN
ncbi:Armadillo-type fold [Salix suchowensis]|nr:Armadillo-type fold [Salix suchowensis]